VHVIAPQVIEAIPKGAVCDINADIYPRLIDADADAVGTWLHEGWWCEAGTPRAYLDLNLTMLARDGRSAIVGPGFFIDEDARVTDAVLGDHVRLERNVVVERSVVWGGATAGPGAVIRRCVVAGAVDLPGGASFEESIIMRGEDGAIDVAPLLPQEAPARPRARPRPRRVVIAGARGGGRRRKGR
jgi:NDP-sugar pyrophosphorylase family protein